MQKQSIAFVLLILSLLFFQCRKSRSELEKLPPKTQTGAETFGCLINGKVFKPKGDTFSGPILRCAYQFIDGGYHFQLKASQDTNDALLSIGIFTDSLAIKEGETIKLFEEISKGKASGLYGKYIRGSSGMLYSTQADGAGELRITKFDETARIVSGTFWFDGVNQQGEKVQVREGRFDLHYTL